MNKAELVSHVAAETSTDHRCRRADGWRRVLRHRRRARRWGDRRHRGIRHVLDSEPCCPGRPQSRPGRVHHHRCLAGTGVQARQDFARRGQPGARVMFGVGTRRADSGDPSHVRKRAQTTRGQLMPRARVPQYGRVRNFSRDSDARGCAPVEAETLPGRLRRWTTRSPTPRPTTATRGYRS